MKKLNLYHNLISMILQLKWNKLSKILKKLMQTARKTSSLLKRKLKKLIKKTKLKKETLKKKNLIIRKTLCLTAKLMVSPSSTLLRKSLSLPKSKPTSILRSTPPKLCQNWARMKSWPTPIKLMIKSTRIKLIER